MEKQFFTKNFRLHLLIPAVIVAVALVLSLCGLGINAGVTGALLLGAQALERAAGAQPGSI